MSRGLLILHLLLLAGELVCQGSILQLHARQGVLDVRKSWGLGSLELQCCRGRGLGAQLVLECHIGIVAVAPLLQQRTIFRLMRQYRTTPTTIMEIAPDERTIDTFTLWAASMCGDSMWSPLISPAGPMPCGGMGEDAFDPLVTFV